MSEPNLEDRVLLLENVLCATVAELHGLKLGTALWMMERLPNVPPMEMLEPVVRQRLYFKLAIDRLRSREGPWQIFAQSLQDYDQQIARIRAQLEDAWARPGSHVRH